MSLMIDGATDKSVSENEVTHARIIANGEPKNIMLDLKALEHSHADGLYLGSRTRLQKWGWKRMS